MEGPLQDVKILDFTHLLPGQICSGVLSDLGGEILHIEPPGKVSLAHKLPPIIEGESLYFWALHKRKSSLKVDLKKKAGLSVIENLLKDTDIILENFRPGVMERLGLSYDAVKSINEKLIYCSISGYGQNSSDRDKPAHDLNLIAESGLLNLNRRDGEKPVIPSIPISDYMSGFLSVISILGALLKRNSTNTGTHLDINMFDSAMSSLNILSSMALYTNQDPEKGGFSYPLELHNYNSYECKDERYLSVASLEPQFMKKFLRLIEREELFDSNLTDSQKSETIGKAIKEKTLDQWRQVFEGSNCCVSPVNTIREALMAFPLDERGMLHHLIHPQLGSIPQVSFAIDDKLKDRTREHFSVQESDNAKSMLLNSGYTIEELNELESQGVISLYNDHRE